MKILDTICRPEDLLTELWRLDRDKRYHIKVEEISKARSLNANAYYWTLVNQIATVDGDSARNVHMELMRNYGVAEVMAIDQRVDVSNYFEYYEPLDREGRYIWYTIFKPSHTMDTKEFTRLLDGATQYADARGIRTLADDEYDRMMADYERRKDANKRNIGEQN